MFSRKEYKKQASLQLNGRRLLTIYITVINFLILSLFSNEFKSNIKLPSSSASQESSFVSAPAADSFSYHWEFGSSNLNSFNTSSPLDFLLSVIMISITGILVFAKNTVYNEYYKTTQKVSLNVYISAFTHFVKGAFSMLWYSLWVTLWSFLFLIPGIVKSYSYRQMFYIIAENPGISVTKAMNISKAMTKGHKADLFIMDLSFIGWFILSAFTLGILLIWVIPYYNMTCINAYKDLKMQALNKGEIADKDFIC